MKIGIIVGHPTQFEGPFYQYAARTGGPQLRVILTNADRMAAIYDPELPAKVSWGIDLLGGYDHALLPKRGRCRWLRDELKRERYDLLIVNGYNGSDLLLAAWLARRSRTPVALRLDSVLFSNVSSIKRLAKRAMFAGFTRLYDHFFAIGNLTVKYLEHFGISRERVAVFSYVVDNDYFRTNSRLNQEQAQAVRRRYQIPDEAKVILSIAKFESREAPWDLLKAFAGLPDEDVCLLLVGDGAQRAALEEYAVKHLRKRCRFAGYVPYPELPSLYGMADLFVHPAWDEPWGVSVQEALACGLPVIASSKVGAGHDLITPGKNGFIYQAGNVEDLRGKLAQMLGNLDSPEISQENERLLAQWSYATTWRNITAVAERYSQRLHS